MRGPTAFALLLVLGSAGARAGEAPPVETRWYGWQIMLADAAGVALIYAGAKNDTGGLVAAGAITLTAVPPVIHFAHHAPGDGFVSFLIRTVPFGASLALFGLLHPDCGEGCGELAIPVSGLILSGAGAITDWILLSSERVEPTVSLAPVVPLDRRRAGGFALTIRF
jgi:hypothetical protein